MYKALKNVKFSDKEFLVGDIVPNELVEQRHIKSKKVELVQDAVQTTVTEEVTEELLIEDSSSVEIQTSTEEE